MLFGLVALASAALGGDAEKCDIVVGELVPNAHVARELADVIIRGRQTPEERSRYVLHVEPDGETGWFVFQGLPNGSPDAIRQREQFQVVQQESSTSPTLEL